MLIIPVNTTFSIKKAGSTGGYDGHCLRAYSYFGHLMPDIQQASENEKCFKLTLRDQTLYVKSTDTLLLPDGSRVTPEQYCSMQ